MTASKIVVDSWAWVEILKLSAVGKEAKAQLERADEAFTPSLVLAELARKYLREGVDVRVLEAWLRGISEEVTEICPIDIELAVQAAKASSELVAKAKKEHLDRPGLGDAILLATARAVGAKLLSGDPHFKGMQETLWLEN